MREVDSDDSGAGSFSESEEEFFRAGDAASAAEPMPFEAWSDLDTAPPRTSLWSRLVKRLRRSAGAIEIARARQATQPGV